MLGYSGEAVMATRSVDVTLALTCVNRPNILQGETSSEHQNGELGRRYSAVLLRAREGQPLTYKQTFIKAAVGAVVAASSAALNRR
jgi:hypothetical protein